MTITEIRNLEEKRANASDFKTVHLIKEGDFYRAHDWSAWLLTFYPVSKDTEKSLKVLSKKSKDGYIDVFCGFPCSSMNKYIPNDDSIEFVPVSDGMIDVIIPNTDLDNTTYQEIRTKIDEWKETIPQTEKKQKREEREIQEQFPKITKFSDIISKIISVPIEDISPRQAYDILRELRREVVQLF